MNVLGIADGHCASACLMESGQITWAIQEERLVNRKNEPGMPRYAIGYILNQFDGEVDEVVLATKFIHEPEWYREQGHWERGIRDYFINKITWPFKKRFSPYFVNRLRDRKKLLTDILKTSGIPWKPENIKVVEHHTAHAASALYGSHYKSGEEITVVTADGSGDGLSATVSTGTVDGELFRDPTKNSTRDESPGEIYSLVTYYLGFRPWEHEYKLMGMAPYSQVDNDIVTKLYNLISVKNGKFVTSQSADFAYDYIKKMLYRKRFDRICASLQRWFEETMKMWIIVELLQKYRMPQKIACAGGAFMNVKANMVLAAQPEIEDMYITPSAGDESTSIGAAMKIYADYLLEHDVHPMEKIQDLGPLYLGPEAEPSKIEDALKEQGTEHWEFWRENNVEQLCAQLLQDGNIVARCSGRMEFGARALGNRSIMADATNLDNIEQLNHRIKHRDFWMAFTPSIMWEERERLIDNPKDLSASYMIMAFPSLPDAQVELKAAMHTYDKTVRPQQVEKEWNEEYWHILRHWRELTGNGGFLNTSFNLHGFPIVKDSVVALDTMKKSGLEYLVVNDYVIHKTENI